MRTAAEEEAKKDTPFTAHPTCTLDHPLDLLFRLVLRSRRMISFALLIGLTVDGDVFVLVDIDEGRVQVVRCKLSSMKYAHPSQLDS